MSTDKPNVSNEVDGFYGISVGVAPLVLEAMRTDPSLSDFGALDARFDKALLRLAPSDPRQVKNLTAHFPEASVIQIVRGKVASVMSMGEYANMVRVVPPSDSSDDPVGC